MLKLKKEECLFTVTDLITFLNNIDELKHYYIELRESFNGMLQVKIGNNVYTILDDTEIVDL